MTTSVYTSPATQANGDVIGASIWNPEVVENVKFLADAAPKLRVRKSAVQSIPNTANTALTWDIEDYDNDAMHTGSAPTRLTAVTAGKYAFTGLVYYAPGNGTRITTLFKNGVTEMDVPLDAAALNAAAGGPFSCGANIHWAGQLIAGDYLELVAYQSSGAALNVTTRCFGELHWFGAY